MPAARPVRGAHLPLVRRDKRGAFARRHGPVDSVTVAPPCGGAHIMPKRANRERAVAVAELLQRARDDMPGIAELATVYGFYQEALATSNAYLSQLPGSRVTVSSKSQV